jgi:hypothetical protein
MPIYVTKDNQQSGPYEDHVVVDQLKNGMLSPNDLGIRPGETSWQKLGDMFPGVGGGQSVPPPPPPVSASTGSKPGEFAAVPAHAKKGGCLKVGLISIGLASLLLGICAAVGSRFIPSVSCDLVESDSKEIQKLNSDLDKAKKAGDTAEVRTVEFQLKQALSGAEASQANCDQDKLRNNIVGAVGGGLAVVGFLLAVIGFFVGRKK